MENASSGQVPMPRPMLGVWINVVGPLAVAAALWLGWTLGRDTVWSTTPWLVGAIALGWLVLRIVRTRTAKRLVLLAAVIAVIAAGQWLHREYEQPVKPFVPEATSFRPAQAAECAGPYLLARSGQRDKAAEQFARIVSSPTSTAEQRSCAERGLEWLAPSCEVGRRLKTAKDASASTVLGEVLRTGDAANRACALATVTGASPASGFVAPVQASASEKAKSLGPLAPVVDWLLWLIPATLLLLVLREFAVGFQLRRAGPVELVDPRLSEERKKAAGVEPEAIAITIQEHLHAAGIGPAPLTPGGVGTLVISASVVADNAKKGLGQLIQDAYRFAFPQGGYRVGLVLHELEGKPTVSYDIHRKADGKVVGMGNADGASWHEAADVAACRIYSCITSLPPVARRLPVWNRWRSGGQGLSRYLHARDAFGRKDYDRSIALLSQAVEFEPVNVPALLSLAQAHHARGWRWLRAGDDTAAAEDLRASVSCAARATLVAPHLVEPRLRLGIYLSYAARWLRGSGGEIELQTQLQVLAGSRMHQPLRTPLDDDRPDPQLITLEGEGSVLDQVLTLASAQLRLAEQLLWWPSALARTIRLSSRHSMGASAVPWNPSRTEAKDVARAARHVVSCKRMVYGPTIPQSWRHPQRMPVEIRRQLRVLRFRGIVRPRGSHSPALFNTAIAWLWMAIVVGLGIEARARGASADEATEGFCLEEALTTLNEAMLTETRAFGAGEADYVALDPDLYPGGPEAPASVPVIGPWGVLLGAWRMAVGLPDPSDAVDPGRLATTAATGTVAEIAIRRAALWAELGVDAEAADASQLEVAARFRVLVATEREVQTALGRWVSTDRPADLAIAITTARVPPVAKTGQIDLEIEATRVPRLDAGTLDLSPLSSALGAIDVSTVGVRNQSLALRGRRMARAWQDMLRDLRQV